MLQEQEEKEDQYILRWGRGGFVKEQEESEVTPCFFCRKCDATNDLFGILNRSKDLFI